MTSVGVNKAYYPALQCATRDWPNPVSAQPNYFFCWTIVSTVTVSSLQRICFVVKQFEPCLRLQTLMLVMAGSFNIVLGHIHDPVVMLAIARSIGSWSWPNWTKISQKVYAILELWSDSYHSFTKQQYFSRHRSGFLFLMPQTLRLDFRKKCGSYLRPNWHGQDPIDHGYDPIVMPMTIGS